MGRKVYKRLFVICGRSISSSTDIIFLCLLHILQNKQSGLTVYKQHICVIVVCAFSFTLFFPPYQMSCIQIILKPSRTSRTMGATSCHHDGWNDQRRFYSTVCTYFLLFSSFTVVCKATLITPQTNYYSRITRNADWWKVMHQWDKNEKPFKKCMSQHRTANSSGQDRCLCFQLESFGPLGQSRFVDFNDTSRHLILLIT